MLVLFKLVMATSLMGGKVVPSENNQCPAHRLAVYKLQLDTFWSEQVLWMWTQNFNRILTLFPLCVLWTQNINMILTLWPVIGTRKTEYKHNFDSINCDIWICIKCKCKEDWLFSNWFFIGGDDTIVHTKYTQKWSLQSRKTHQNFAWFFRLFWYTWRQIVIKLKNIVRHIRDIFTQNYFQWTQVFSKSTPSDIHNHFYPKLFSLNPCVLKKYPQ